MPHDPNIPSETNPRDPRTPHRLRWQTTTIEEYTATLTRAQLAEHLATPVDQLSPDDLDDYALDAVLAGLEDGAHHTARVAITDRQLTDIDPALAAPAETPEDLARRRRVEYLYRQLAAAGCSAAIAAYVADRLAQHPDTLARLAESAETPQQV